MGGEFSGLREHAELRSEHAQDGAVSLFPGAELSYLSFRTDPFTLRHTHSAMGHILQISYCKCGQMEWDMGDGKYIYLNPGDFSLHTLDVCAKSRVSFPTGRYSGLTICVDLQKASAHPPDLLTGTDLSCRTLREKFCPDGTVAFLAGNEQTERIFSAFYGQPDGLKLPYQRLKFLELLLYLAKPETAPQKRLAACQPEQIEIIRKIHDRLIGQISERLTIGELSREYLMNPTTLKTVFKAVYGTSIAAHIKEHRMEQAARMLRETDMSIAEIAQAVGYDSQSRFTAAFKTSLGVLPREYRRNPVPASALTDSDNPPGTARCRHERSG